MSRTNEFILTLACRDTTGIVYAVSGLLYQAGCNIIDSQQFGDVEGADLDELAAPKTNTRLVDFGTLPADGSPMPAPEGPGFFQGLMNSVGF